MSAMRRFAEILFTSSAFILLFSCTEVHQVELQTLDSIHSEFITDRQVDVWTPHGYPAQGVLYSTLYMHDGQMLFDSNMTWNHQEWGVDECLQRLIDEEKIKPCIVVAVWNTEERFAEYAPEKPMAMLSDSMRTILLEERLELGQVKSDAYLQYLVRELKPTIEAKYAVSKDRKDVFIAGSSMGGLISMYALMEYPEVFGGAACISTHWPLTLKEEDPAFTLACIEYMRTRLPVNLETKLYFDHGDQDLDALYPALQARVDSFFYNNNTWGLAYMSKAFPGKGHRESFWRERLDIPLEFLLFEEKGEMK